MKRNNHHLRELSSVRLECDRVTNEFRNFAIKQVVEPLGVIKGYKQDEKTDAAIQIISNLLLAGQRYRTVADSRDRNKLGVKLRVPIWDAFVAAAYARLCVGSEQSSKVTRYYATRKLLDLFDEWELKDTINLHFDRGSIMDPSEYSLVVIRPGKNERDDETGEILTKAQRRSRSKPIPRRHADWIDAAEDRLDFINRQNLKHSWQVTVVGHRGKQRIHQPAVTLQQQHVAEFMDLKRLYTPGRWGAQQLSKDVRQTMLIDGEPVAEFDYKCSLLRLLYHLSGKSGSRSDLYRPDVLFPRLRDSDVATLKAARSLVKRATIIAINTKSPVEAYKALEKWIQTESGDPELYFGIMDAEGTAAEELVRRIPRVHKPIKRNFFRSMGKKLMSLESTIIENVCMCFASSGPNRFVRELTVNEQVETLGKPVPGASLARQDGKPVLPIHDAVVCKASDAEFAKHAMVEEYRRLMDFSPVVQREF